MRGLALVAGLAVLFASEAWATSTYNQAVLDDNPLFYWTFDEPGNTANAMSHGASATLADELVAHGGATRSTSAVTPGGVSLGRAATFDGSGATRFLASDLSGTSIGNSWAVEFWMKYDNDPTVTSTYSYFMQASHDSIWNTPSIWRYPDHVVRMSDQYAGPCSPGLEACGVAGGPSIADAEWHHVVLGTLNSFGGSPGSLQTIVLDGVSSDYTGTNFNNSFTLRYLAVGNTSNAVYDDASWSGKMDEFAIYDFAIDSTDPNALNSFRSRMADLAQHRLVPEPTTGLLLGLGLLALRQARTSPRTA